MSARERPHRLPLLRRRLRADRRGRRRAAGSAVDGRPAAPGQPRRDLPQAAAPARRACTRADRATDAAVCATSRDERWRAVDVAPRRSPTLAARLQAIVERARPRRDRVLHLRPAADRGLLRGQQARQGLPRHQQRRLELAPVHVAARSPATREALGSDGPPAVLRRHRPGRLPAAARARTPPPATRSCGRASARRQAEGATVIVVDPRRTTTAAAADLHLPVRPGRRPAAAQRDARTCSTRDGPASTSAFVARHTEGVEEALAAAAEWTPERAAEACGVAGRGDRRRGARASAGARRAMALWSMGANQSTVGTLKNRALNNLCLATGNIGRPGHRAAVADRPAERDGRARDRRARAPAARLPHGRRSPRTAPRCGGCGTLPAGRARASRPRRASPRPSSSRRSRTAASRRSGSSRPTRSSRSPTPSASPPRCAAPSSSSCQDAYHPTETGALAHVVAARRAVAGEGRAR